MPIIKLFLFHLFLSFRGIILVVSKLLSFACLGSFALVLCVNDLQAVPLSAKIVMLTFGIIFTSIYWFYDYLILYLKPKMLDIVLLK